MSRPVIVSGSFDDLRSRHVRFLQEASRLGPVHAVLWSDAMVQAVTGAPPAFPLAERFYFLQAIRYAAHVFVAGDPFDPDALPALDSVLITAGDKDPVWAVMHADDNPRKRAHRARLGVDYQTIHHRALRSFPDEPTCSNGERRAAERVIVTGCFDWLHTGHVRFFEEASELGELYVVVGHDENVTLLKGRRPMFGHYERRYMAGAIRYVRQALISSGSGWMDAAPEIEVIRPTTYLVNEDGDRPEKREFCEARGLRYVVLERRPRPGLPTRHSTALRGF